VQILDSKDRSKIKSKAEAGDILRYTIDISQQITGIKNVTIEDNIPYRTCYLPKGSPVITSSDTVEPSTIEALARQVGGKTEEV
jgi:hypothetical protein